MKDIFGKESLTPIKGEYIDVITTANTSLYTKEIVNLFTTISNIELTPLLAEHIEFDCALKPIIDVIEIGAKKTFNWNYTQNKKHQIIVPKTNNVVVCFSGGKDSTATALKMRKEGKNVFLYHINGINRAYPDEIHYAIKLAKKMDMPICIESLTQTGHTSFKENPIKNQLIASMALDYAIKNKLGCSIAFGDFTTDNINNSQFLESWSDTQEMWKAFNDFVKTHVPNVEVIIPFKSYNETFDVISDNKEILDCVCGCILPYRFRKNVRKSNEEKYHIDLLPNRCGSCWKCCTEYIYLADKKIIPLNKEFYVHCLKFLLSKLPSVHPEIKDLTIENAYFAFLHRDFSKSILN